jgi:hypothetical protein
LVSRIRWAILASAIAAADPILRPDQLLWNDLKRAMLGPSGDEYFASSVKGAHIPGGIEKDGVQIHKFRAELASWKPETDPRTLELRVVAEQPDVMLHLESSYKGTLRLGMECTFSGIAAGYSTSPLMMDLDVNPSDLKCH